MGVKGLQTRVRRLETKREGTNDLLGWLNKSEAELEAEIEVGRADEDLRAIYHCVRKWLMEGALR